MTVPLLNLCTQTAEVYIYDLIFKKEPFCGRQIDMLRNIEQNICYFMEHLGKNYKFYY